MSLLQGIINPAQANIMGAIDKGVARQDADIVRQGAAKDRQSTDMAGQILGDTLGGKLGALAKMSPDKALQLAQATGIPTDSAGRMKNFMGVTMMGATLLESGMHMEAAQFIGEEADKIESLTGQPAERLRIAQQAILNGDQEVMANFIAAGNAFKEGATRGGKSAGQKERADLLNDLNSSDPNTVKSAQIQLGLKPRAVGSAVQTITEEGTAEDIGDTEAVIAQRKKFGEMTGISRAKFIDKGFDTIVKIDKNIRNLGRAITALDGGASTGVIESKWFPSFRKATLQLEALQKELSLDVIGAVTFGALSQGELDLAMEVALPTNLEPADLKEHLIARKAAQEKLRGYYQEQIDHLDQGGTIASFLRSKSRDGAESGQSVAAPSGAAVQPKFLGFE